MQKVTDLIDIAASCEHVFDTVVNIDKRMQLSPLWGLSQLLEVGPNFPQPGSCYRVRVLNDAPYGLAGGTLNTSQSALPGLVQALFLMLGQSNSGQDRQSGNVSYASEKPAASQKSPAKGKSIEQVYYVTVYEPPHKFGYHLDADCKTNVTWGFQSIPYGTRINYEEDFCDEYVDSEDFLPRVRYVIHEWLNNIKRYSELHAGRGRLIIKWFMDRFYLRMRPDQRRIVLVMIFMQAIGLVTFLLVLIGWGIARLLL